MKTRYIDLMEAALSAYSYEHITRYFNAVKTNGLTEHGFPRLTANIGILIAHGRRRELLPLFLEMMDFCCNTIPRVKAANDFSVREIINCLAEVEEQSLAPKEQIAAWKAALSQIDPYSCYTKIAKDPEELQFNWALFTAVSEFRRNVAGLADTAEIIDIQLATQLKRFDENGMYRDDNQDYAPMVYDHVPRALLAILLRLGYCGKYRDKIDEILKNAALLSLKMQSVTGEIPFGGRSNQCVFNEAILAIIFEYETARYLKMGNFTLADKFKAATCRALNQIAKRLSKKPIFHVKNRYPLATKHGCENYAYFDKYMITTASFLYEAYLCAKAHADVEAIEDFTPVAWQTSRYFHALFLRAGGYSLQFDTAADLHYDASGLGRVHKTGAPSAICLSLPCPEKPFYTVQTETPRALSLCAGVKEEGEWRFATGRETVYQTENLFCDDKAAALELLCSFANGMAVKGRYTVSEKGVTVDLLGEGDIAFSLPAFAFDGETHTEITVAPSLLEVRYEGYVCRYETSGNVVDLGFTAENRNGCYRAYAAVNNKALHVKITIEKDGKSQ